MSSRNTGASWRGLIGVLCAGLMAGCGGGGGGGSASDRVSAVFDPPSLSVSSIEGFPANASFTAAVNPGAQETLYLGLQETRNLVVDGDANVAGQTVVVTLVMSSTLPPGVYTSEIQLLACSDEACAQQVAGSPMRLPLRYEVLPQITIQAPAPMRRTGREAAPVQSLAVTLPAAAGQIAVSVQGDATAFGVNLQGDRLVVQPHQVPSGTYTARVELSGSSDSRYRASVDLSYVVEPPADGEKALRLAPNQFDLRVDQGTRSSYRFKVERPTWTDALDPVTIFSSDFSVVRNVIPLGNDEYEFTVDTSNLPEGAPPNSGQGAYYSTILVRAGDYGGAVSLSIAVYVNSPLNLGSPDLSVLVSATTTAADLVRATAVNAADGAAVRWSASSNQPWLRLLRSTGITGVDELQYEIDTSVLNIDGIDHDAQLAISVDRPGTLPVLADVVVRNFIPRFDMASPGVLTSASAKVYVHGLVRQEGEVLTAGVLSVTGATLRRVGIEEDPRFAGSIGLLAVELDGIVPGQPVTISAASPLRPTAVTLASVGALRVAAGYAPLPFGRYRPPTFAPGTAALVFSSLDTVWRWPLGANGWGVPQQKTIPAVIDAAMAPDESDVFAIGPGQVLALDPTTLALRRQGALSARGLASFDPTVATVTSAVRFAADGRAFASLYPSDPTAVGGRGVGWLAGCPRTAAAVVSDLTNEPCFADPGAEYLRDITNSSRGTGVASSANGGTLAMSYPSGKALLYRGIRQQRQDIPDIPAGTAIVSIDNAGTWSVRDDGLLQLIGNPQSFDLRTRAPQGFVPGGYAISGSGGFVAMYTYRIASEAGGPRARDARLLLFDIRNGLTELINNPTPAAHVDLPDAVGCTAPLAAGETCEHQAAVLVAQGGKSLFVVGPRGVAAAPLPLTATFSTARTRPATLLRTAPTMRQGVR